MIKLIRLVILRILLGLNKKYPNFRNYYAIATNIWMHLFLALQLLVAWGDYTHGEPAWDGKKCNPLGHSKLFDRLGTLYSSYFTR